MTDSSDRPAALVVSELTKSFGSVQALRGLSLEVRQGEIHGLVGHNGSGKSTLVKILSGFHHPDSGSIQVNGKPLPLPLSSSERRARNVAIVHQDLGLVPTLSVVDNLRVGRYRRGRTGLIPWRDERQIARQALRRFGVDVDPTVAVSRLGPAQRTVVALVRGLLDLEEGGDVASGLLVLDETTAALPAHEVNLVFEAIRQANRSGTTVIFVTHSVSEVFAITTNVSALQNGRVAHSAETSSLTRDKLIDLMAGRQVGRVADRAAPRIGEVVIEMEAAGSTRVDDLELVLRRGEIVGVTGLVGSGHEDVPYLVFGAKRLSSGRLSVHGTHYEAPSPARSRALGLVLLPADRQHSSGLPRATLRENITIGALRHFLSPWRTIQRRHERDAARNLLDRLRVTPPETERPLLQLSGGNQQKALIGRCLLNNASAIVLDEPTLGIDVGSRQEIVAMLRRAAADGAAVLVSSCQYEDLPQLCDRVVVLRDGRTVVELVGPNLTEQAITAACHGRSVP